MEKKRQLQVISLSLFLTFFLVVMLCESGSTEAIEVGKTYDHSNYQEVKDSLAPSVEAWVKRGDFIIRTAKLEYEWKYPADYLESFTHCTA